MNFTQEQIAKKAYEKYMNREKNHIEGTPEQDWQDAIRDLKIEEIRKHEAPEEMMEGKGPMM